METKIETEMEIECKLVMSIMLKLINDNICSSSPCCVATSFYMFYYSSSPQSNHYNLICLKMDTEDGS